MLGGAPGLPKFRRKGESHENQDDCEGWRTRVLRTMKKIPNHTRMPPAKSGFFFFAVVGLMQLCVFGPSFLQNGYVRVGVFQEGEEVLIRGFGFSGVACMA